MSDIKVYLICIGIIAFVVAIVVGISLWMQINIFTCFEKASSIVTVIGFPLVIFTLIFSYHQDKAANEQTRGLIKAQILQYADRAIWNEIDGGDFYSYDLLEKMSHEYKNEKDLKDFISNQLIRVKNANSNIYIVVNTNKNSVITWAPQGLRGIDVPTASLIGLMKSDNHWMVRACSAQFLSEVTSNKMKDDNVKYSPTDVVTELRILKELAAVANSDSSLAVRKTALLSFAVRCTSWKRKDDYDFDGLQQAFDSKICEK